MGFATRQAINTGRGERNRKYSPRAAEISAVASDCDWSRKHNVVVEIKAVHNDAQLQVLLLSAEEVADILPLLVSAVGQESLEAHCAELLAGMSSERALHVIYTSGKPRRGD